MMISYLRIAIFIFFIFPSSTPSARANTFIIVLRTEEGAIVAADSKIQRTDGSGTELACKIHVGQIVWATAGIKFYSRTGFDVWKIAEKAIGKGGSLDKIVSAFDTEIIDQLKDALLQAESRSPEIYESVTNGRYPVKAVFIQGTEIRFRQFFLRDISNPNSLEAERYSCPGNICPTRDLRLFFGEHTAADAAYDQDPQFWPHRGIVNGINYLMERESEVSALVGPPYSILKIDRSNSLQWLQNGYCNQ